MNKYFLVALSVMGGILCSLAWTGWCSGLIMLLALVPFFTIEDYLFRNAKKFTQNAFFIYLLPGFVVFSILTLGWMRIASVTGAICVIMGLSFTMSFTLFLAHLVRLRKGDAAGFIALIVFWLGYEYITLNVNIISPWLNLGNGLAKDLMFIQWYEVTGTAGGTLWILCSNLFLTLFLVNQHTGNKRYKLFALIWVFIIILPAAISITRYYTINTSGKGPSEVVIVQPNCDPYTDKFVVPFEDQLKKVVAMAKTEATSNTAWIITPETTVDDPVDLDNMGQNKYIKMIRELAAQYPGSSVVGGLVTYRVYPQSQEPPTKSARITDASGLYSDHFNSALRIDTGQAIEVYHKSKLVPGIEMQFSTGPGRFISRILPYLGGTKWGYGMQDERSCFRHPGNLTVVGPIICYESVFGSFVTGYVRKGAEALFIITNDGWWKNTRGYRQHLSYASLRAIETRRPIARAANTGVSCFIDIRGIRTTESSWWSQSVIKGNIIPEQRMTFYVKHGDLLLEISAVISVLMLIAVFVIRVPKVPRVPRA